MKKIPLHGKYGKDKFTLVDNEDFDYLNQWKWYCLPHRNTEYAVRGERRKGIYIHFRVHRVVTNCPDHLLVDHENGNGLDNQKNNLKVCTNAINCANRHDKVKSNTGFRGVYLRPKSTPNYKKRYMSLISVNMKRIFLGNFYTAKEAYDAYIKAAIKYRGDSASKLF